MAAEAPRSVAEAEDAPDVVETVAAQLALAAGLDEADGRGPDGRDRRSGREPAAGDAAPPGAAPIGAARTGGGRTEGERSDVGRIDAGTGGGRTEPGSTASARPVGARTDSARTESGRTDAAPNEAGRTDAPRTGSGRTEPWSTPSRPDAAPNEAGRTGGGRTDAGTTHTGARGAKPTDVGPAGGAPSDGAPSDRAPSDRAPSDRAPSQGARTDGAATPLVGPSDGTHHPTEPATDPPHFAAAAVLDVLRASGWADAAEAGQLRAQVERLRELLDMVIRDHRTREASAAGVENQQLHWLVPLLRSAYGVAFGTLGAKVALRTAIQEVPAEVLASAGLRLDHHLLEAPDPEG